MSEYYHFWSRIIKICFSCKNPFFSLNDTSMFLEYLVNLGHLILSVLNLLDTNLIIKNCYFLQFIYSAYSKNGRSSKTDAYFTSWSHSKLNTLDLSLICTSNHVKIGPWSMSGVWPILYPFEFLKLYQLFKSLYFLLPYIL